MAWRSTSKTGLYNECVSKGHYPVCVGTGGGDVKLYCRECERVWMLNTTYIRWLPISEWTGKEFPLDLEATSELLTRL